MSLKQQMQQLSRETPHFNLWQRNFPEGSVHHKEFLDLTRTHPLSLQMQPPAPSVRHQEELHVLYYRLPLLLPTTHSQTKNSHYSPYLTCIWQGESTILPNQAINGSATAGAYSSTNIVDCYVWSGTGVNAGLPDCICRHLFESVPNYIWIIACYTYYLWA